MGNNLEYKCISNENEKIPEDVINNLKLSFKDVHFDGFKMSTLSKEIEKYNKDIICRVPFSNTVEAESLGSEVIFSDSNIQARIGKFAVKSLEDIYKLNEINLNFGSINETLKAVKLLQEEGKIVCILVEGPFTIASQLMDSSFFYKLLLKEKEAIDYLFNVIERGIFNYIKEALSLGVSIISYADPAGTLDLVGPRVFRNYSGKYNHRILKKVQALPGDFLIHLCGKTSSSLEGEGFAKKSEIKVKAAMSYGQGILEILQNHKNIKILGNGCIKISHKKNLKDCLWHIELC